jgi:hypothetical protein
MREISDFANPLAVRPTRRPLLPAQPSPPELPTMDWQIGGQNLDDPASRTSVYHHRHVRRTQAFVLPMMAGGLQLTCLRPVGREN